MAESDFEILNKFGGDLKIQLRKTTISCCLSQISANVKLNRSSNTYSTQKKKICYIIIHLSLPY